MLAKELTHPQSIAVIGGSNSLHKPGGMILKNLMEGKFPGKLYVVNPKEDSVQGVKSYPDVDSLPNTDLAILAVASRFCTDAVETLTRSKGTKGFIILSAGFAEESEEGRKVEQHIASVIEEVGGSLIGPNCIGVINQQYRGVFTSPIPKLDPAGCDFISGSGATAVFFIEAGIPNGLTFSSIYSVGNSAQVGVEDVLQHLDETFDPGKSSRVILLYLENIDRPELILKHASSLIRKGCRIAAIKSGTTEAGSRAASSHTGALASPDAAVDALLCKAGIVRCYSREELVAVASVFQHKPLEGKRIGIVTHAGGPAVMLTDILSEGGLEVPRLSGPKAEELLELLHPGSSVANPIDIIATGRAEQLGHVIDYCEKEFDEIDGMIVIYGTPGLFRVTDEYRTINEKMKTCSKPIFPVLPSVVNAREEIDEFLSYGRINFPDEVKLGRALAAISNSCCSYGQEAEEVLVDREKIREILDGVEWPGEDENEIKAPDYPTPVEDGHYLWPETIQALLDAAGIPRVSEAVVTTREEALLKAEALGFPLAMKVVGPLHKSDVGGVALNIKSPKAVFEHFEKMIRIEGARAVMLQPMLSGIELYAGAKKEDKFGHQVLCGMGGIFIEALKDVKGALVPLGMAEAGRMIKSLQSYPIIQGVRGQHGVDEMKFAEVMVRLSQLLEAAPEISEMDLNPLLGKGEKIIAVDARIRIN